MTELITSMPLRVRYHECDGQGIVFNAHYLAYADMACFEVVRELYGSYDALREHGVDFVLAEANVRFRAPCRYDDELHVDAYVERLGNTSVVLRFDMMRGEDHVTEVTNRYVWVDTETLRPAEPPAEVRKALQPYAP